MRCLQRGVITRRMEGRLRETRGDKNDRGAECDSSAISWERTNAKCES